MSAAGLTLAVAAALSTAAPPGGAAGAGCARSARERYEKDGAPRLVPLLRQVIAFSTVAGDEEAVEAQQRWLERVAGELGLRFAQVGPVSEVELPGPDGGPVIGLVVHGDVVPVEATRWRFPPFQLALADGLVQGRGVADDKGPLVGALLAMHALADAPRTHTIRLLVGSDEESGGNDMAAYLGQRPAPDWSLVLDSEFPVVVGEKAWDLLVVRTPLAQREAGPFRVAGLEAGLAYSIVPDRAEIVLEWAQGSPDWGPLRVRLAARPVGEGLRVAFDPDGARFRVAVTGHASHAGINIEAGRNALVGLARLFEGVLPRGGADDLLAFARLAGQDLYGTGLGLTEHDPLWGRYAVNVATLKPEDDGTHSLSINLRRNPPRTKEQMSAYLEARVAEFERRSGARFATTGSLFFDEPLVFDPDARLVRRLRAAYARVTGEEPAPVVSGGGTYAKRVPRSIAFGMWFPGEPYPGHDVDERMPLADLHRGVHIVLEALGDLACSAPLARPFEK